MVSRAPEGATKKVVALKRRPCYDDCCQQVAGEDKESEMGRCKNFDRCGSEAESGFGGKCSPCWMDADIFASEALKSDAIAQIQVLRASDGVRFVGPKRMASDPKYLEAARACARLMVQVADPKWQKSVVSQLPAHIAVVVADQIRALDAAAPRENLHPQAQILEDVKGWKPGPTLHLTHTGFGGESWPTCVRDKSRSVRKWALTSNTDLVTCLACLKIMIKRAKQ